ncbi:MAG TPA: hypothetical protein DER67_07615 [Novosphingobium sp.]|nr:hypothetical protein [Novosphingobium sp.]
MQAQHGPAAWECRGIAGGQSAAVETHPCRQQFGPVLTRRDVAKRKWRGKAAPSRKFGQSFNIGAIIERKNQRQDSSINLA